MYLEMLSEKERKIFMDLAYMAMECDGEVAEEELEMIRSYEAECRLPGFKRTQRTFDECIKLLKQSEMQHRRIILLELIGIWAADNVWKTPELNMMDRVSASLGISQDLANRMKRWSREFREIIADGFMLMNEE